MKAMAFRYRSPKRVKLFWRLPLGLGLNSLQGKRSWQNMERPDSIWLKCPELCSMVAATLSKDAVKEDKVSFRAQQMWLDAAVPLTACLEKAHGGELTVADTIPMIQSAIMLIGDASQHQSTLRRKLLMQHFNSQLKGLMGESDSSKAQPFLFGEDFGDKREIQVGGSGSSQESSIPV